MDFITITYNFKFPDQTEHSYTVNINEKDLTYSAPPQNQDLPDWTKLENHQCVHCPLNVKDSPHCPIAVNLSQLVEFFKNSLSYEKVTVTVTTKERNYSKALLLQEGIFSIFGLIMSVSS